MLDVESSPLEHQWELQSNINQCFTTEKSTQCHEKYHEPLTAPPPSPSRQWPTPPQPSSLYKPTRNWSNTILIRVMILGCKGGDNAGQRSVGHSAPARVHRVQVVLGRPYQPKRPDGRLRDLDQPGVC